MDAKNLWLSNIIIIRMKKYLLMAKFKGVTTQTFLFFFESCRCLIALSTLSNKFTIYIYLTEDFITVLHLKLHKCRYFHY